MGRIAGLYTILQAILVTALNLYWYSLILKGLKRLLEHAGVLKVSENANADRYKDLEKFEEAEEQGEGGFWEQLEE